jgi:alkanesulfonate monooxygenase SsuD/methylene tetrahydromethanopterin reductase-like flavin-dependent oxidoreductase (luciferase family)
MALLGDAGRDPTAFDPAYYLNVVLADSEAVAIEKARTSLEAYYPRLTGMTDEAVRAHGAFGPPDVVADALDRYRAAGVERFVVRFTCRDQAAQLERFGALID